MKAKLERIDFSNPHEIEALKTDLMANANLPGKHVNLKLMHAFSDALVTVEKSDDLFRFLHASWHLASNGNDPETLPVICGLIGLAHYYFEAKHTESVKVVFSEAMNDSRWRVREVIQEAFKILAHRDWGLFCKYIDSISQPTLLEWRAIITTLAHPEILRTDAQVQYAMMKLRAALEAFETAVKTEDIKSESFIAFNKGMCFAPSVIMAVCPNEGMVLVEDTLGHSKIVDRMLKSNLKKQRLLRRAEAQCMHLIYLIDKQVY